MPIFAFSQIEAPWPLGPPDGRYLVRAPGAHHQSQPTHVLLFTTLSAQRRGRLARRRRPAPPQPAPTPVSTGRATIIATEPFTDAAAAARWLAAAGEDELAAHLHVLERTLHAFRVVTADPYGEPLARERLLVARVGFGEGEEVADGRWSDARQLLPAPESRRRSRLLEPQSRLAGVLGGHVPLLVCEELTLRARRDLDAGRVRQAVLQLRIALDAALSELAVDGRLATRVTELSELKAAVDAAAQDAKTRGLTDPELEAAGSALTRLEAALRARTAALP
ncbi:MAG TPA: hypothetical protein VG293_00235 [Solirubrobacteraceae bacterium]|nr:hypothetical protein [Solirubrobacteraceae bacterium]